MITTEADLTMYMIGILGGLLIMLDFFAFLTWVMLDLFLDVTKSNSRQVRLFWPSVFTASLAHVALYAWLTMWLTRSYFGSPAAVVQTLSIDNGQLHLGTMVYVAMLVAAYIVSLVGGLSAGSIVQSAGHAVDNALDFARRRTHRPAPVPVVTFLDMDKE